MATATESRDEIVMRGDTQKLRGTLFNNTSDSVFNFTLPVANIMDYDYLNHGLY